MELEERIYTLPMTGAVINWKTFSGDPANPIRPINLTNVIKNNTELNEEDKYVNIKPKKYDVDNGEVEVLISATKNFHDYLSNWLKGKSMQDICNELGEKHLIFDGSTSERPDENLAVVL